jgi:hypothetical protein
MVIQCCDASWNRPVQCPQIRLSECRLVSSLSIVICAVQPRMAYSYQFYLPNFRQQEYVPANIDMTVSCTACIFLVCSI